MMYRVDVQGKKLIELTNTDLRSRGLLERYDLQEWIEQNPRILGDRLRIIAKELILPSGKRLDLLAIDENANLVVIELKRDNSGSDVDMQAIRYASYVSNFTSDDIFKVFAEYLGQSESDAEVIIEQFISTDIEVLNQVQRLIVVAGEFHPEVVSSVLWLRDNYQVDIVCVRLRTFADEFNALYITPDIIIPLPEAKDYIQRRETKQRATKQSHSSSFSMEVGNYEEEELRSRLYRTLTRDSNLTPRLYSFFEILLSSDRKFMRDEIIEGLYYRGIGNDIGHAGRLMSGISQAITKTTSDHIRQIIDFTSDGGAGSQKDDFYIKSEYRNLVRELILELNAAIDNDTASLEE